METTLTLEAIDQFQKSLFANGVSLNTVKAYTTDLKLLWMKGRQDQFTPELVTTYLQANRATWSPSTFNRKLGSFRAYAKWLGMGDFLAGYRTPTVAPGLPHPLPGLADDLRAMLKAARKPSHKALVALCGFMGLRISEALAAKDDDLHSFEGGGAAWLKVRGKGDKTRDVPVTPEVLRVLLASSEGVGDARFVPLTDRAARRAWTRIGARAGVSRPTSSHDGRMTFGTLAFNNSKDIRATQELLGHASVEQTQLYTGVSADAKRAAANII